MPNLLSLDDFNLCNTKTGKMNQLAFGVMLSYFRSYIQFPSPEEQPVSLRLISAIAEDLDIEKSVLSQFNWGGRTAERYHQDIRKYLGYRQANNNDVLIFTTYLINSILPHYPLYTGVRVSELVKIKISDIDLDSCQIRVIQGKGNKDRIVPFPNTFTEVLAVHIENAKKNKTIYLFESSWRKPYTDRGIRKILMNYTKEAGIERSISPHKLRHFLFTWMKKKGVDDALIQPYSGHESRQSLEIYSKLSLVDCQPEYEKKIKEFPI